MEFHYHLRNQRAIFLDYYSSPRNAQRGKAPAKKKIQMSTTKATKVLARQSRNPKGVRRSPSYISPGLRGREERRHAIGLSSVSANNDRQTFAQAATIFNDSNTKFTEEFRRVRLRTVQLDGAQSAPYAVKDLREWIKI
jgi:hypothetical protein